MHVFVLCLCSCGDAGLGKSAESLTHWPWHHCLKVCHLGMIQEVESVCLVSGGGYGDDWGEVPGTELQRNINCEQVRLSWQLRMQSVCLSQTNGSARVAFIWFFHITERYVFTEPAPAVIDPYCHSNEYVCVCVPQRGDLILAPVGQWAHILPSKQPTTQGMVTRHTVFSPLLGWTCQLHPV